MSSIRAISVKQRQMVSASFDFHMGFARIRAPVWVSLSKGL